MLCEPGVQALLDSQLGGIVHSWKCDPHRVGWPKILEILLPHGNGFGVARSKKLRRHEPDIDREIDGGCHRIMWDHDPLPLRRADQVFHVLGAGRLMDVIEGIDHRGGRRTVRCDEHLGKPGVVNRGDVKELKAAPEQVVLPGHQQRAETIWRDGSQAVGVCKFSEVQ